MRFLFQLFPVIGMILISFSIQAQNAFFAKEISPVQNAALDEIFTSYRIFDVNISNLYEAVNDENLLKKGIRFQFGEAFNWEVDLIPHDIRSANYIASVSTPSGVIVQPKGGNITYEGHVKGGSEVSMTIDRNFLYGYIHMNTAMYFIEPANKFASDLSQNYILIYKATDVRENAPLTCGLTELRPVQTEPSISQRANQCYITEVAVATDYELFSSPGYGSVANIQNRNIAIFNNVAVYYRHEFDDNIEMQIVEQWIATTNPDPWTNSTAAGDLLNSFTNWGNGGGFTNTYDIAQLVSGRDLDNSTVGLAWVGSVCTTGRYSIVQDLPTTWEKTVDSAHEIGHNFNASHDASGSPYIMAPAINNTSTWSAAARANINKLQIE